MEERTTQRVPIHFPVLFLGTRTVNVGTVTDLSLRGCTIKSTTLLRQGDYVELRICLPVDKTPLVVNVAAVRWALGGTCGVEFVVFGRAERSRISPLV